VRADLLPAGDALAVRELLKKYLDQRLLFYPTRDPRKLAKVNADTAELQSKLWSAARAPAAAQPTPIVALAISGMNDVLNSQEYTQAAWCIPRSAWVLMVIIPRLQRVDRVRRTSDRSADISDRADCGVHLVLPDR
jgi:hypothetical protein